MNSNQTRTLWISIAVAAGAMFLLYGWSQQQRDEMHRKFGAAKQVLIAHKDIAEMQTIDDSMIEFVEKPAEFVEPGAIADADAVVGWVAEAPISKGEQFLKSKLIRPGPDTGMSFEVSPTKRAITVPIDDVRGVSRLIRPGDRIDLIAAIDSGRGTDQKREVRTILQDVPVLATGLNMVNKLPRRVEADADGKNFSLINMRSDTQFSAIVVEVKPDEAQKLIFIMSLSPGSIFATLRNPNDRSPVQNLVTTTIDDVLQRPSAPRQPAAAPPPAAPLPPQPKALPKKSRGGGFQKL
jgi:pilus assembly protein CpaB